MSTTTLRVENISSTSKQQILGLISAFIAVLIWSSYFLSLKIGSLTPLTLVELTSFRYAIPGLLLLPVFVKSLKDYAKVPLIYLAGIVVGAGLPFFLLSAYGMQLTQVAYGSTLIPGTGPLFVTLFAVYIFKQPLPRFRKWGIMIIAVGIIAMLVQAGSNWDTNLLLGQGLFLMCALMWASYTICIRQSKLAPLKVAALATLPNGVLIILWILITKPTLGYSAMPISDLVGQIVVQGIFVGIFSGLFMSIAIMRIGAEKTSAIGAMTPVVATFLATIMLGEQMDMSLLIGMLLVIGGVVLASGVIHGERVS